MKNLQQSLIQVCALLLALPMLIVNSIAQATDFPTAAPEDRRIIRTATASL
jgi:hypothetical protein